MNRAAIRAERDAGNSTWEVLHAVVAAGREYPDAVFAVAQALNLDQEEVDDMEDAYLNNC